MQEDIYIKMLRFGKSQLENGGFRRSDLIIHLQNNGHKDITEHNAIVKAFFPQIFFSLDGQQTNHSSFFHIRPEVYMQLLEYDKMVEARRSSKEARWYSIIALAVAFVSLVVSIVK